jgi:hypothetical protein
MKSQIVPVLLFCAAFPWIAARVYQAQGRPETLREDPKVWNTQEAFSGSDKTAAGQPVIYEELSTKQINFLIP